MTIGSILVPFAGHEQERAVLETAFIFAREFGSHIRTIYMTPSAEELAYSGSMLPVSVSQEVINAMRSDAEKRSAEALLLFKRICEQHQFPLNQHEDEHVSASWAHLSGNAERLIAREARLFDMVISCRNIAALNEFYQPIVHAALFDSARPILLLPPARKMALPKRIALAWDGSSRATHALAASLPLLQQADKVVILTVGHAKDEEPGAERLQEYLHLHDIECSHEHAEKEAHAVGEMLVTLTKQHKADMLVMGAFTHNRFRQMIIGGVTDYMLNHADVPVFMAH